MGTTNLLETKTVSLNELLGGGKKFLVPQFQRDYSWNEDNWEDLWIDIRQAEKEISTHYMGSIVLQNNDGKTFKIIDGQQRFSTLSILILAIIKQIIELSESGNETSANEERAQILMNQYIGQKDPASLKHSSKLFLNENNNAFYQRLIDFKEPINSTKLLDSEKLLWNAYLYFRTKIKAEFTGKSGEELALYLNEIIGEQILFIQIVVENELNAYTVFETLNSRGIELTSTDLLKNYLFSLVAQSESDLKQVKNQWKKIVDAVRLKDFPTFLRQYLNSRMPLISKEYLFKAVKQIVKTGEDVFEILDLLETNAYTYVALSTPEDSFWEGDKETKDLIRALNLFRVTQCNSLLMIAYEKLELSEFKKVLKSVIALSFRYNVIAKLQTNDMEKVYNKTSINLFSGKTNNVIGILNDLKPIYLDDDKFKHYFELKELNTNNSTFKKLARYILYSIEEQIPGGCKNDYELDDGTIEHILPEAYNANWSDNFTEEEHDKYVYLLGNYTLLEPSKNNREAADKSFADKKGIYATSKYTLSRNVFENEWSPKAIKQRQAKLAKTACGIWQVQYPSIKAIQ